MMFAMIAVFPGALLGLRFRVLILAPAILISSAAMFSLGTLLSVSSWSILGAMVLAIIALEIGYLTGSVIGVLVSGAHIYKDSSRPSAITQKPILSKVKA